MKITCPRCSGVGHLDHFKHIQNGICFLCHGNKEIFIKDFVIQNREICISYQDNRKVTKYPDGRPYPEEMRHEYISIVVNYKHNTEWTKLIKITDQNRQDMRDFWKFCKQSGYTML